MQNKKYKIDAVCFSRTKKCLSVIFTGYRSDASLYFIFLLGICIGQQLVIYNVGLLPSQFFTVLGEKNSDKFNELLIKAFSLILGVALYNSAVKLVSGYLYIKWRRSITKKLHEQYFYKMTIYNVNFLEHSIDNIDQRITQDVDRFCQQLSDISAKLIISPLTIIYYSVQCFNDTGYLGPVIIYTYFILATVANKFIMATIVTLIFKQEKCEGDFRFKHSDIRMNAESIAFMKGEKTECYKANTFFNHLLAVQKNIINKELFLNLSVNLFDYIGSILSYIIISIPIFAGAYNKLTSVELTALISKNAFVSMYLIGCFSSLIDLSSKITDLLGYTHRIGELFECLTKNNEITDQDERDKINSMDNQLLSCEDLTYLAPNSTNVLISNLNLNIAKHENLLITGKTGCGKSSLIRILANIWQPFKGRIKILSDKRSKNVMFIPQKAYLSNGSLIDIVIYPLLKQNSRNTELIKTKVEKVLADTGLHGLINRAGGIDVEPDWRWSNILSPGEIQRLCFARLFYHKPLLAIMDEPTSSLGVSEEDCFYTYCQQLNITVVSIGHRDTLKRFHKYCLHVKDKGEWDFVSIT